MADASPKFALYVSSVPGRLVSRPGSPHSYIGARVRTPDEVKAGLTEPEWFPDVIVPVLESEYRDPKFVRHWDKLLRNEDLVARSAEDFAAYQGAQKAAEDKRDAELAAAAKADTDAKAKADAEAKKAAAKTTKPADQGGA